MGRKENQWKVREVFGRVVLRKVWCGLRDRLPRLSVSILYVDRQRKQRACPRARRMPSRCPGPARKARRILGAALLTRICTERSNRGRCTKKRGALTVRPRSASLREPSNFRPGQGAKRRRSRRYHRVFATQRGAKRTGYRRNDFFNGLLRSSFSALSFTVLYLESRLSRGVQSLSRPPRPRRRGARSRRWRRTPRPRRPRASSRG